MQPYDLPIEQLKTYLPANYQQADFEQFWDMTQAEMEAIPHDLKCKKIPYPVASISVYLCHYTGFNGAQIEGVLAIPNHDSTVPGIVTFHGYNWCFDGNLHATVNLALKGYAVFNMQCRGQQGGSQDNVTSSNGHVHGWMTKGVLDKNEYYYRAVYMDAVRAVELLATHSEVQANKIAVMGSSQGGGLALACAALSSIPCLALAEYPYLCNFPRAIDATPNGPYGEFNEFFRRYSSEPNLDKACLKTLSYFDVMNLAPKISCKTWMGTGLIDDVTPPSTIYATYNHLICEKSISVYRYFGHEVIPASTTEQLTLLFNSLYR